jgi:hypothetical protein
MFNQLSELLDDVVKNHNKNNKKTDMTLNNMTFFGEEIIIVYDKIVKEDNKDDAFHNSNMNHEKDMYARFKVVKIGKKQLEYKEGDYVLINKNGLPTEISIEGVGKLPNTYSLPTHQRIYCKINV